MRTLVVLVWFLVFSVSPIDDDDNENIINVNDGSISRTYGQVLFMSRFLQQEWASTTQNVDNHIQNEIEQKVAQ